MDYTVTVEMSVTTETPEKASKLTLDDLRDKTIGPWNMEGEGGLGCLARQTISTGNPDDGVISDIIELKE